jgi:hypothetical protein
MENMLTSWIAISLVIIAVLEWWWPITTTVEGLCRFYLLLFAVFLPNWKVKVFEVLTRNAALATCGNNLSPRLVFFGFSVFFLACVLNFIKIEFITSVMQRYIGFQDGGVWLLLFILSHSRFAYCDLTDEFSWVGMAHVLILRRKVFDQRHLFFHFFERIYCFPTFFKIYVQNHD